MHQSSRIARTLFAAVLTCGLAAPSALAAQLAVSRANTPVLVMDPIPASPQDTAFALALADAIRDRMDTKYRFKLRIVPTETICEAKEASGFQCDFIFSATNASALARFLQVQGSIISWLARGPDSLRVRMRLVNSAGSGLAGWTSFAAPASISANDFGRQIADGLEDEIDAASDARECDQRRSQSDFRRAREKADDTFEQYPNHPAAAQCVALLFEIQGQPVDSIIWADLKAVRGDSVDARAWERLGRAYVQKGDTTGAIDAFLHQLALQPGDLRLAEAIAAQLIQAKDYRRADSVLAPYSEFNPEDMTLLTLREQACYEGHMWWCALAMGEQLFQLDSVRQSNMDYKFKEFSAAQSWEAQLDSNTMTPDSAAKDSVVQYLLNWSDRLVQQDTTRIDVWQARAQALKSAGRVEDAVGPYRHILALDSTQVAAAYAAAQILWDSTALVIDSTVPLDTARLFLGDSLWTRVTQLLNDTSTWTNVAVQYYRVGNKLVGQRMRPQLARQYLTRTLELDRTGALTAPANFFMGLNDFFQVIPMYQALRASQRCADIPPLMDFVARTRQELTIGRAVAQEVVDSRLMPTLTQVAGQRDALRANFCRQR